MGKQMREMLATHGPSMDRIDKQTRECKDHPGMADAIANVSFRKAKE
jgi:hypothetical protein